MRAPHDTVELPGVGPDAVGVPGPRSSWFRRGLPPVFAVLAVAYLVLWITGQGWWWLVMTAVFAANAVLHLLVLRSTTGLLLVVDDRGLRMRNQWRGWTTVAWADVTGLEIEESGRVLRVLVVPGSVRRHGRPVAADHHRFVLFGVLPTSRRRLLAYLEHRRHRAVTTS